VLFTEQQVTEQSVKLPKEFLVAYSVVIIIPICVSWLVLFAMFICQEQMSISQKPKSLSTETNYSSAENLVHYINRVG